MYHTHLDFKAKEKKKTLKHRRNKYRISTGQFYMIFKTKLLNKQKFDYKKIIFFTIAIS